jgi:predicted nucleotidyltransferase
MSYYLPLFSALNSAGVRYVIVGGLATVLHGYARFTADVDLIVDLERKEAEKAVKALTDFGLKPRLPVDPFQFADPEIRELWQKEKHMEVFSFFDPGNPLVTVDLFVYEPAPFPQLHHRARRMDLGEIKIPVCSIEDLIDMKMKAARSRDLDDIEHLREIQRIQKQDGPDETGER